MDGKRLGVTAARLQEDHEQWLSVRVEPVAGDARGRSERWRVVLTTKTPFSPDVLRGTVELTVEGEAEPFAVHYVVHQR